MNERDIERHVRALVDVAKTMDKVQGPEQKASLERTLEASGVALFTNFLVNQERAATALERIADCLEEKNK